MSNAGNGMNIELPPCGTENSILETNLKLAARQKTINKLKVMETPTGYYVVIHFGSEAEENKIWYLVTQRNLFAPRVYKSFERLNKHLQEICPNQGFELFRNQKLPPSQPKG